MTNSLTKTIGYGITWGVMINTAIIMVMAVN